MLRSADEHLEESCDTPRQPSCSRLFKGTDFVPSPLFSRHEPETAATPSLSPPYALRKGEKRCSLRKDTSAQTEPDAPGPRRGLAQTLPNQNSYPDWTDSPD